MNCLFEYFESNPTFGVCKRGAMRPLPGSSGYCASIGGLLTRNRQLMLQDSYNPPDFINQN